MFMEVWTMANEKKWQLDLGEYIRQEEPAQAEKSESWQIAIGLQQVDGLETSDYLLATAKDHIEVRSTSKKPSAGSSRITRPQTSASILKMTPPKQISFPPESPNF